MRVPRRVARARIIFSDRLCFCLRSVCTGRNQRGQHLIARTLEGKNDRAKNLGMERCAAGNDAGGADGGGTGAFQPARRDRRWARRQRESGCLHRLVAAAPDGQPGPAGRFPARAHRRRRLHEPEGRLPGRRAAHGTPHPDRLRDPLARLGARGRRGDGLLQITVRGARDVRQDATLLEGALGTNLWTFLGPKGEPDPFD